MSTDREYDSPDSTTVLREEHFLSDAAIPTRQFNGRAL